jgi:hypothetical protein
MNYSLVVGAFISFNEFVTNNIIIFCDVVLKQKQQKEVLG